MSTAVQVYAEDLSNYLNPKQKLKSVKCIIEIVIEQLVTNIKKVHFAALYKKQFQLKSH